MNFEEIMNNSEVEFGDMQPQPFLLGLLSAFDNRYQAFADSFFAEITWKQFFAIICINLCKEPPTINQLSSIMGSSHQNVKQILIKLAKKDFVVMVPDGKDRRKQRVLLTKTCQEFCERNDRHSQEIVSRIFNGIDNDKLMITIQTIIMMERNLSEL